MRRPSGAMISAMPTYGPDNPYPLSTRKTELVWEGKYDEFGGRLRLAAGPTVQPPLAGLPHAQGSEFGDGQRGELQIRETRQTHGVREDVDTFGCNTSVTVE